MRLRDYLRVLSELKPGQKINVPRIARKTNYSEAEVKKAITFLTKSAIISETNRKLKINVQKLN